MHVEIAQQNHKVKCTVKLQSKIAQKLHDKIAWQNNMVKLHSEIIWENCTEKLHGKIAWEKVHVKIAW